MVGRVAQDGKRLVHTGEVRFRLVDKTAEILEDAPIAYERFQKKEDGMIKVVFKP